MNNRHTLSECKELYYKASAPEVPYPTPSFHSLFLADNHGQAEILLCNRYASTEALLQRENSD